MTEPTQTADLLNDLLNQATKNRKKGVKTYKTIQEYVDEQLALQKEAIITALEGMKLDINPDFDDPYDLDDAEIHNKIVNQAIKRVTEV